MKKLPKKFILIATKKPGSSPAFSKATASKEKSPSNSRNIPEKEEGSWIQFATIKGQWEGIFLSFIIGVLLMGIIVMGQRAWTNLQALQKQEALRGRLEAKRDYWERIVTKYPDYKDALYQLALASYELGERDAASESIKKALMIDPNDRVGLEMASKLQQ